MRVEGCKGSLIFFDFIANLAYGILSKYPFKSFPFICTGINLLCTLMCPSRGTRWSSVVKLPRVFNAEKFGRYESFGYLCSKVCK